MISITAEYALRAVVFLGRGRDQAWTTRQVAGATHVPVSYLSKVLQALVRAEIIESVRGIYGGYRLATSPGKCTVLEVINSVDPIRRIRRCPLGLQEHGLRLCPLHSRLDAAVGLAESAFADTTIAELLAEPDGDTACRFPPSAPRGRRPRQPRNASAGSVASASKRRADRSAPGKPSRAKRSP